jgi:hypothetical protein
MREFFEREFFEMGRRPREISGIFILRVGGYTLNVRIYGYILARDIPGNFPF